MPRIAGRLMHGIAVVVLVGAGLFASSSTAVADPAVEPPPAPPLPLPLPPAQDLLAGPADALLGPVDQLAPVTLLAPETYRMPDGQQPSPYVLTQGAPPGLFPLIDEWKGVHALLHGAMGRMPEAELGGALPGTAPPPGTALPPGLEEFLPEPVPGPGDVPVPGDVAPPPPPVG
ncbi:MAG TPA: hypothetical protein PKK01_03635 [Mycobacterium sp.]|nr:MAG: hypothetical protein E6Q56_12325 [Mycobacterium sp.]HOB48391.1 hypothetical protein [Mycobacterium sp.]HQE13978.1 hypothetical protein [Mycobacterium sp.]